MPTGRAGKLVDVAIAGLAGLPAKLRMDFVICRRLRTKSPGLLMFASINALGEALSCNALGEALSSPGE